MNLEQLISTAELQSFKQILRKPDINEVHRKSLLTNINKRIKEVQNEIKTFKSNLLMNEGICFVNHEKSSSFGKLYFYSEEYKIFSNNCGQLIQSFSQNQPRINLIQVDKNSKKLIAASNDGIITIWDLETCKSLKTLQVDETNVKNILFIPNNKFISGSKDKTLKLWDLNSYECLNKLKNESPVWSLCSLPNNRVACGDKNGSIHIWDLNSFNKVKSFKAHDFCEINYLLSDGITKLISFSGSYFGDRQIKIWNIETFELINSIFKDSFSVNCFQLTSNGNLFSFLDGNTIKLWKIDTCELLNSIELYFEHSGYRVKALNEVLIAVGFRNGQIQIYNFKNKEIVITIPAHQSAVNELLLLKNGCLLSRSENGEIKLWKIFDNN